MVTLSRYVDDMQRKATSQRAPETGAAAAPTGRIFVDGQLIKLAPGGRALLKLRNGRQVPCRLASTIDRSWLEAALEIAPVDAEGTVDEQGNGSVWCIFPGPEHAEVAARTLSITATERITLRCGKSSVALEKEGALDVRGRDIMTRGSRSTRLSGGIVRIN
jgi:dUTPase